MASAARIVVTGDVLRQLAYREVLREIAKGQPFDPAAQIAREVLAHFGDEGEDQP